MAGIGGGGGKIPGHSGTDFKHRKAFGATKSFYKKYRYKGKAKMEGQSYQEMKATRKIQQQANLNKLLRFMIPIALLLCITLWGFNVYFPAYINRATDKRQQIINEKIEIQKSYTAKEAYKLLVNSGDIHLSNGKLDAAQFDFVHALRLYPNGKAANSGLTQILITRCAKENRFCKESKEYIKYMANVETLVRQATAKSVSLSSPD